MKAYDITTNAQLKSNDNVRYRNKIIIAVYMTFCGAAAQNALAANDIVAGCC